MLRGCSPQYEHCSKRAKREKVIIVSSDPTKVNFSCIAVDGGSQFIPNHFAIVHKGISKGDEDATLALERNVSACYDTNIFANQDEVELFFGYVHELLNYNIICYYY